MVRDPSEIGFAKVDWTPLAAAHISKIRGGSVGVIRAYERMVQGGERVLWSVSSGPARIGSMVWHIETDADGEGAAILDALYAKPVVGVSVADCAVLALEEICRIHGLRRMRFWTQRPGLVKKMKAQGFAASWVMEREL